MTALNSTVPPFALTGHFWQVDSAWEGVETFGRCWPYKEGSTVGRHGAGHGRLVRRRFGSQHDDHHGHLRASRCGQPWLADPSNPGGAERVALIQIIADLAWVFGDIGSMIDTEGTTRLGEAGDLRVLGCMATTKETADLDQCERSLHLRSTSRDATREGCPGLETR